MQHVGAEAEARGDAGTEVLHEDVGVVAQPQHEIDATRGRRGSTANERLPRLWLAKNGGIPPTGTPV